MSLNTQPLLTFKGLDKHPTHGTYASHMTGDASTPAIQGGLDRSLVVTFEDATRHLIALGSTGFRKTTTVLAPAVVRLIETGCAGLIIDVKGEYRHLADQYPDQVMVIGADDDATPINLIAGMSQGQFEAFLQEIWPAHSDRYWGSLGIQDALFVRRTYQLMGMEPTLAQITDALTSPRPFVEKFDAFMRWAKTVPRDYNRMVNLVRNNAFSILAKGQSTLWGDGAWPNEDDIHKQYTWQTGGLLSALSPFTTEETLQDRFSLDTSESDNPAEDLQSLLYRDRKVLLLDVPVDRYGQTAHVISKLMRIRLISAVTGFDRHDELRCGTDFFTFFAADEYQHMVNLDHESASQGLFDDTAFFDRCRAFGHINLVATQSVSALAARLPSTERREALDCLLQNIGTAFVFSSADPATDHFVTGRLSAADRDYVASVLRSDLAPGEAFLMGRGLRAHDDKHVVARFAASAIPGLPHMSRYFRGMPAPGRRRLYTETRDAVKNHFRVAKSRPPIGGLNALKQSFEDNIDELIDRLETAYLDELLVHETLLENRDYRITFTGCLNPTNSTLIQPNLQLSIARLGDCGWSRRFPMNTVFKLAQDTNLVERTLSRFEGARVIQGTHSDQVAVSSLGTLSLKAYRNHEDDEAFVQIEDDQASLGLPLDVWLTLCSCLLTADSRYREIHFTVGAEEEPF